MRKLASSLCSLGLGLSTLCPAVVALDDASTPTAALYRAQAPAANAHFAVALRAAKSSPVTRHVVIVDTSASQTGRYRTDSAALVKSVIEQLPSDHQVFVAAVDSSVARLTSGFVPAGSAESSAAVDQLLQRTPMGATDLNRVVTELTATLDARSTSLLYIGDGMSAADQLSLSDLQALVDHLNARQVAFHAVLVGANLNTQLPGILCNQTGGVLVVRGSGEIVAQVPEVVSAVTTAPVRVDGFHAGVGVRLADDSTVLLRSDRDTIVFGESTGNAVITLTGEIDGASVNWAVQPQANSMTGSELRLLFEEAVASGGLTNSVVGTTALLAAHQNHSQAVATSVASAQSLHRAGHLTHALAEARRGLQLDAGNVVLTSLVNSLTDETGGSADDRIGPPAASSDDPLSKTEARNQIRTQQLVQSTNAAIAEARRVAADQPDYALTLLKDVLETIRTAPELAPESRSELERRLIDSVAAVQSERQSIAIRNQEEARERAALEQQRNLLTETALEEERLRTQIATVRGLLERARKGDVYAYEEAESSARIALDMKPGNGTAASAVVMAEAAGQLSKAYRLINLRHDRFLETLYQVELSHVPFPDEPPVQYPAPEVWRALSISRKKKYKSIALRSQLPVEIWLEDMLDQPIPELNYPGDTSLSEILDYLSDYYTDLGPYTMRILPDLTDPDITDVNFLESVQVSSIDLKGITLRNALKLIFAQVDDPELTYLIKNEVMLITTVATAESEDNFVTRIYDVADLVVITQAQAGGGGGFGGGQFGTAGIGGTGGGFGGGTGGATGAGGGATGTAGTTGGTAGTTGGASANVAATIQLPSQELVTVTTTVSVPDGGTVLLGGVKRLRESRNMAGVPILNKIPYLSRLFKNTGVGRETESLLLMVTPRIIIQEEEEEALGIPVQ